MSVGPADLHLLLAGLEGLVASQRFREHMDGTLCICIDNVCPAGMATPLHPLTSLQTLPESDDDGLGRNPMWAAQV